MRGITLNSTLNTSSKLLPFYFELLLCITFRGQCSVVGTDNTMKIICLMMAIDLSNDNNESFYMDFLSTVFVSSIFFCHKGDIYHITYVFF